MSRILDLREQVQGGCKIFLQQTDGSLVPFEITTAELEPEKLMGFPKPIVDNFMQIMAAIENDAYLTSEPLQDQVRINLKELRNLADSMRVITVPIRYTQATLGELVDACIEGAWMIKDINSRVDIEEFDIKKQRAELKQLKANMAVMLSTYVVNPRHDSPDFGKIQMTPFMDDIEEYVKVFKKVKTRGEMHQAALKFKQILDDNDIEFDEIKLIKTIFTKMYMCSMDATVQAMVIELTPQFTQLPFEIEAHKMKIAQEMHMNEVLATAEDGITIGELAKELDISRAEVETIIENMVDNDQAIYDSNRYYSPENAPKPDEKKGKKKDKGDDEKKPDKKGGGKKKKDDTEADIDESDMDDRSDKLRKNDKGGDGE